MVISDDCLVVWSEVLVCNGVVVSMSDFGRKVLGSILGGCQNVSACLEIFSAVVSAVCSAVK